ncbi:vesicle-associated membrane protein 8-like isoform X3 [Gadus macrocephalus]|uniref:vesicle-associated membrane protein 8-like isoform X3 n=1 Tax=Gadus macrocephalus TaxID=80720 RepID=UPI0028CB9CD3|nr:vesicle-associated membrane protein 8-like isoform X3 [Gadus macrocephalus]
MAIDPANTVQALTERTEEVVLIVRKNVEEVQERARKLSDADERAEALKESTSIRLKRSYDEENSCCNQKKRKLVVVIVVGVLVIILIIVLLATGVIPAGSSSSTPPPMPTAPKP